MADYLTTLQVWPDSEVSPQGGGRQASFSHNGTLVAVHSIFHVKHLDYLLFHEVDDTLLRSHLSHWRGEQTADGRGTAFNFVDQRNAQTVNVRYAFKPVYKWVHCDTFSLAVGFVQVA